MSVPRRLRYAIARAAAWLLAWPAGRYIRVQRNRLIRRSSPLGPAAIEAFASYFPSDLLQAARVAIATDLGLPRFPFQRVFRRFGWDMAEPRHIAAITLADVIAIREGETTASLLFHELVHAVQYRLLGFGAFARLYVQGFLETGRYEAIPLEQCASALEERFARSGSPFNVEEAVARWLEQCGYRAMIRTGPSSPDSTGS